MKTLLKTIVATAALSAAPFAAQAAVTSYTTEAAFMAAVSGTTTIDFDAQNTYGPEGYTYYENSPLKIGDVTFTQPDGRLFVFGSNFYWTPGLTSSYLNENCCAQHGINVDFAKAVHSVGMNLGIQNTWNSPWLDVTFKLSTGDVITTSAPLLYGSETGMAYFGFTSTEAITSFNINGTSQGIAIDNFTFTSAVPEPSTYAMLSLGLLGLGIVSRRKRS